MAKEIGFLFGNRKGDRFSDSVSVGIRDEPGEETGIHNERGVKHARIVMTLCIKRIVCALSTIQEIAFRFGMRRGEGDPLLF